MVLALLIFLTLLLLDAAITTRKSLGHRYQYEDMRGMWARSFIVVSASVTLGCLIMSDDKLDPFWIAAGTGAFILSCLILIYKEDIPLYEKLYEKADVPAMSPETIPAPAFRARTRPSAVLSPMPAPVTMMTSAEA
jgi:hypothetical protein